MRFEAHPKTCCALFVRLAQKNAGQPAIRPPVRD
jgi:hypothetical protein